MLDMTFSSQWYMNLKYQPMDKDFQKSILNFITFFYSVTVACSLPCS